MHVHVVDSLRSKDIDTFNHRDGEGHEAYGQRDQRVAAGGDHLAGNSLPLLCWAADCRVGSLSRGRENEMCRPFTAIQVGTTVRD